MINYDSILSAFDGKPTLLQWLKMVKKALDESILKNINIIQNGQKVVFTFNFEDGTSIITPEVTLPKGDKGDKGNTGENGVGIVRIETTGSKIVGDDTESNIRVELSDGSIKNFKTYAKNGSNGLNGENGVSITGIDTVGNEVVGDETLTTLRANYSDNTSNEFVVKAKNGKNSNLKLYNVGVRDSSYNFRVNFNIYSKKSNLSLGDVLKFIPDGDGSDIPRTFSCAINFSGKQGIATINKSISNEPTKYDINISGILLNNDVNSIEYFKSSFLATNADISEIGEIF